MDREPMAVRIFEHKSVQCDLPPEDSEIEQIAEDEAEPAMNPQQQQIEELRDELVRRTVPWSSSARPTLPLHWREATRRQATLCARTAGGFRHRRLHRRPYKYHLHRRIRPTRRRASRCPLHQR